MEKKKKKVHWLKQRVMPETELLTGTLLRMPLSFTTFHPSI